MQPDLSIDTYPHPAAALTRGIPRDQALGLRLIALARAAAGMHMASAALGATTESPAQESADLPRLLRSQAKTLVEDCRP